MPGVRRALWAFAVPFLEILCMRGVFSKCSLCCARPRFVAYGFQGPRLCLPVSRQCKRGDEGSRVRAEKQRRQQRKKKNRSMHGGTTLRAPDFLLTHLQLYLAIGRVPPMEASKGI